MLDPNNYTIQHVEHEVEKLDIDDGLKDVILATLDRYTKDKKAIKQVHDAYENLDKEKKEKELLLLVAESELEALRAERKAMMEQANIGYIYSQGLRDLNNIGMATIYKEQQKFILSASQRETAIYADPVQPSPAVAVRAIDAMSDDDLWHIATLVSSMSGGSVFNLSANECTTRIRASFEDPDTGRAMLSAPTPPNDERPDIVSTLKDLSVRMIDIGAEMEYTAGFNAEMAAHGRELVGAGMIASDWADKIKESEHEANGCSRVND